MEDHPMNEQVRQRASALFAALAHPTRLRIVELLIQGEETVNGIAAALEITQSGASQHLAILTRAGVLRVEQRGSSRFYRVRGPRIAYILSLIENFCTAHNLYGTADVPEDAEPVSTEMAVPSGK
jgi:ArsR family transcriptional regulator